ncbi:MAG TPA: glycine betaine ABC transporter substrate-binding protein [Acidimicrobiia bacterium]|nr:glycine betaine ABC transporter substrate-binding protein [Acidimicrobiia bacterium]
MRKMLLVMAVMGLLIAACGDGSGGGTEEINLIVNPWTASRLNAEVAANIIEAELGNPVEITEVNENDAMFTGMADGTLDAVLEIWPSGVTDAETAYFDDGSVVDMGELGAVGKIGWFVPQYVIDEHPELATWEGFQDPALAALFATPETGDNGRFLGTDPSYSQYDEQIISNLGLPLQVVFSGSEPATVAEVDARVAAQEPILLYWWTPTAAVAAYDLVNVTLPEYTEECGASAAAGDGGVDCDYPEDVLYKAASGMLEEKDAAVFEFLQNFTITTEDQLEMLPAVEIDGDDPAAVAAEWVSSHEDTWSAWLPQS